MSDRTHGRAIAWLRARTSADLRAAGDALAVELPSLETQVERLRDALGRLRDEHDEFVAGAALREATLQDQAARAAGECARLRRERDDALQDSAVDSELVSDLLGKLDDLRASLGLPEDTGVDDLLEQAGRLKAECDYARAVAERFDPGAFKGRPENVC
jgi:chromosome segregation ATPase